jgi:hypothetical protein
MQYECQSFLLPAVTLGVALQHLFFSAEAVAGLCFLVAFAATSSSIALGRRNCHVRLRRVFHRPSTIGQRLADFAFRV